MAVAYDSGQSTTGTAVTSLTTPSFTISASATAGAIGLVHSVLTTAHTASIGGVAATLVSVPGGVAVNQLFSVLLPGTGSQTATASWTTAASSILGVVTVTGSDSATHMTNGAREAATSTLATCTITTTSGDMTMAVARCSASALSAASQTERWNAAASIDAAGSTAASSGSSDVHTWTLTSASWTVIGATFPQSGGGPPPSAAGLLHSYLTFPKSTLRPPPSR